MAGESAREVARRSRDRAAALTRRAEAFEKGADGEAVTGAVLDALAGAGWTVRHDVSWPGRRYANIDHIANGPGGIFAIDSKNWSGHISVVESVLRQDRRAREQAVAGCAQAAMSVAAGLPSDLGPFVTPVLSFVTDEPLTGWARDVMVCSTPTLATMLTSRPRVLPPARVAEAQVLIDAWLGAARPTRPPTHPPPKRPGSRPAGGSGRSRKRRSRTRRRGRSDAVIGLGMVILMALFGPRVIETAASSEPTDEPARTEAPTQRPGPAKGRDR